VYNGVRHQTSMCKAFVKMPRPYGDQSGGARKWAIRSGCETWFHSGGYHPPAASQFSPPSSAKKSMSGKAKQTARAKQLAIGTGSPEMPSAMLGAGSRRMSHEPFSPSSGHGGPSVGPAYDGTSRPSWAQGPEAPSTPPMSSSWTPATSYFSHPHPQSYGHAHSHSLSQVPSHLHSHPHGHAHAHSYSSPPIAPPPFSSYSLPRGYHYVPIQPQSQAQQLGQYAHHPSSSPAMHYLPTPPATSTHGYAHGMQGYAPEQSPSLRYAQPGTQGQTQVHPSSYGRQYEMYTPDTVPASASASGSGDASYEVEGQSPASMDSREALAAEQGSPMTA
jgi:hypothetical protein